MQVAKTFKKLNENTTLYLRNSVKTEKNPIMWGNCSRKIEMVEDGRRIQFSDLAAPYIF